MELRFLDGKLQYKHYTPQDWINVPTYGLSSQQEPEPKCPDGYSWCCGNHEKNTLHNPASKPKTAEEWCEHIRSMSHYGPSVFVLEGGQGAVRVGEWSFCPICGTPRPKVKSLREKFEDEFVRQQSEPNSSAWDFSQFVTITTDHFNSTKERAT